MSAEPIIHYRATVGNLWCVIDKQFHSKGVLIPTLCRIEGAAIFETKIQALAAVKRTEIAAESVRISSIAEFPKFKPLLFKGRIELSPFHVLA